MQTLLEESNSIELAFSASHSAWKPMIIIILFDYPDFTAEDVLSRKDNMCLNFPNLIVSKFEDRIITQKHFTSRRDTSLMYYQTIFSSLEVIRSDKAKDNEIVQHWYWKNPDFLLMLKQCIYCPCVIFQNMKKVIPSWNTLSILYDKQRNALSLCQLFWRIFWHLYCLLSEAHFPRSIASTILICRDVFFTTTILGINVIPPLTDSISSPSFLIPHLTLN